MPLRDDIDHVLVRALQQDPRLTNRALAALASVSTATVATRLERLRSDHCLAMTVLCDWVEAGYSSAAVLLIRTQGDPRDRGRDLAAHPGLHTVNVLVGRYDLFALVLGRDLQDLARITDEVRHLNGVTIEQIEVVHDVAKMTLGLAPLPLPAWDPEELVQPRIDLDPLDHKIVGLLAADGHQSNREVARLLGINETTVRSRLARLEGSGLLRLVAVADPTNMGLTASTAIVTIRLAGGRASPALRRMLVDPRVAALLRCVGTSDAIAVVSAESDDSVLDVMAALRASPAVADVTALPVIQTIKHRAHLTRFTAA